MQSPLILNTELLCLVILAVCLSAHLLERQASWLANLNSSCFIIVTSLCLSTLDIVPKQHVVYDSLFEVGLPVLFALLGLSLNLEDVKKIRGRLLGLFAIGVAATLIGGLVGSLIMFPYLGTDGIKISSQLVAGFIGGGENAVAMRSALSIPDDLFVSTFTLDNIVTSAWMLITLAISNDKAHSDDALSSITMPSDKFQVDIISVLFSLGVALAVVEISRLVAGFLNCHPFLIITTIALIVGQISHLKVRLEPSYLIGNIILSLFFFALGATGDFKALATVPLSVIALPLIVLGVHALILYGGTKPWSHRRVEKSLISQALIGGSGTAVAFSHAKQWPQGVVLGLVLGLLGYAIGNYFGVLNFELGLLATNYVYGG